MKRSLFVSIFTSAVIALILASCASKAPPPAPAPAQAPPAVEAPAPTPEPAAVEQAAPVKVAKQRTVVTKVPVLVKEATYYSDGQPDEYFVYKLDEGKKNVVEKDSLDTTRPDPVQRLLSEYSDGLLTVESVYESNGALRSRRELSYDAQGRLAQERTLDAKGKVQSSSAYAYDAAGRKIEWRVLDSSGAVKATSSYTYGTEGMLGVEMKDAADKSTGKIKLEYAAGLLAKRSYLGSDGTLQKYEAYSYEGGLLASVEYRRADGSLSSKTAYSRGPLGELVKAVEYDASGASGPYSTYEYVVREDSAIETYYE